VECPLISDDDRAGSDISASYGGAS